MQILSFLAGCLLCGSALATEPIYGNDSGCGLYQDTDSIQVSPTRIEFFESACDLPADANYSGKPMILACGGDEESFTGTISLEKSGDTLIYRDAGWLGNEWQPETITLHRCP